MDDQYAAYITSKTTHMQYGYGQNIFFVIGERVFVCVCSDILKN